MIYPRVGSNITDVRWINWFIIDPHAVFFPFVKLNSVVRVLRPIEVEVTFCRVKNYFFSNKDVFRAVITVVADFIVIPSVVSRVHDALPDNIELKVIARRHIVANSHCERVSSSTSGTVASIQVQVVIPIEVVVKRVVKRNGTYWRKVCNFIFITVAKN